MLLSTLTLAGFVARALIRAVVGASPAGVSPTDASPAGVSPAGVSPAGVSPASASPPFHTIRQPVFWHIIILAALSRLILYGLAFLASKIYLGNSGGFFESLPGLCQRSDASHYISIAENWYVNTGEDRVFLVFLPLFPLIIKLFAAVFGNAVFSGIVLSNLAFIASCVLIYEIALLIGQDEETAYHAVKYAVFFPASFFTNGAFSEGLFLLTSALLFHYLLRKKWIAAGIFGLLASFTRYYGLLLIVPYAIELALDFTARLRQIGVTPKVQPPATQPPATKSPAKQLPVAQPLALPYIMKRAVPILLIPIGTGLFLIVNYAVSGNFFQFLIYQKEHWSQQFSFFFINMRVLAENALTYDQATSASLFIPQIIYIVLFIALMAYSVYSKFHISMLSYLGVYYLVSISAYWMLSFPRYIFGAIPVFSLMAAYGSKNKAADALVSLVCISGLVFLTIAYTCGFHVY